MNSGFKLKLDSYSCFSTWNELVFLICSRSMGMALFPRISDSIS